jgi:hypothetical protein
MKFGVREICDVVFKAKAAGTMGNYSYSAGQPVLYIDSAKTSTIEGAATTVYAQGGRGNSKLIAWEGEKTLTFTVEDALLSPVGFAILSGAGLMNATASNKVKVHCTALATMSLNETQIATINLTNDLPSSSDEVCGDAPVFVMMTDKDGSLTGDMVQGLKINDDKNGLTSAGPVTLKSGTALTASTSYTVFVDFYVERAANATELTIDAENFAGYYYVEASTLFRRQYDGVDLPAEIVFPNVKIQSNFTFSMASSGDPSTFTFTMDAMPGYTAFNKTKKVLCAIQVIEDAITVDDVVSNDSIG